MNKILALGGLAALVSGQALTDVVDPGSAVKLQAGFQWTEGALYDKTNTRLVFADTNANKLKFMPNGQPPAQDQANPFTGVNAQLFDTKGRRVVCEQLGRKLSRWNTDGTHVTLAEEYQGMRINSPNDIAIWKDGSIFFSDPPYGVTPDNEELGYYAFWRVHPDNTLEMVTSQFHRPNGICFNPAGTLVYVNDIEAGTVWTFPVDPTTGNWNLDGKAVFLANMPWPDGMKTDVNGNVYIVGADGLRIYTPNAQLIGTVGGFQGTNIGFGDADFKTIYISAKTEVWKVQGKVAGLATDGSFGQVMTSTSQPLTSTSAQTSTSQPTTSAQTSTSAPTTANTPSTSAQPSADPTSANPTTADPTSAAPTTANPTSEPVIDSSTQNAQSTNVADPSSCEQTTATTDNPRTTGGDDPTTPIAPGTSDNSNLQGATPNSSTGFNLRPEMLVFAFVAFLALF